METYLKSMAGPEHRRSVINLQFMLESANCNLEGKPPLLQKQRYDSFFLGVLC
jgi:hypothetical protein